MNPSSINLEAFREALVDWYSGHRKDYPWRRTRDPWAILISEMMLQQTQVATVLDRGYFARWMVRFPTPADLAAAEEPEVLSLWEGLGYYNRARNLQRAAVIIRDEHNGSFPSELSAIESLPGIGRYTAAAVYSFAFNKPAPLVDANVARVIARLYHFDQRIDTTAGQKFLWNTATELLDEKHPRVFNSALMELGQAVCKPRAPRCKQCPVTDWCQSFQQGRDPSALPIKKPKRETVLVDEHAIWSCRANGAVLLQCESATRRKGLWKLPLRNVETVSNLPVIYRSTYGITHHRVTLTIYKNDPSEKPRKDEAWIPSTELPSTPMASPFRKALDALIHNERN